MLHGVSVRLLHNPPLDQMKRLFARLRQDGCDSIALIPQHYISLQPGTPHLAPPPPAFKIPWVIYPDVGQDKDHPYHNTPEPELVLEACQAAAAAGLRVMLKPHIDSYAASWRGYISVKDRTTEWVGAYRYRFLTRYLDIARQIEGTILCLGCELYTVTKELGPEFWIGLAQWVRGQGFRGPLTYAAHWGWAGDAEYRRLTDLWPYLDYIGVDAHFPLVPQGYQGTLDAHTLAAAWHRRGIEADWCPRIDDDLLDLSHTTGKPLLFTAIGYANHRRAAEEPGREALPSDQRDDDLQARLAQAFRRRWDGVAELAGYFWWEAGLDQAARPLISHDIIDQPVEAIVCQAPAAWAVAGDAADALRALAPIAAQVLSRHGLHAPNSRLADFHSRPDGPPEGADAVWQRVGAAQAHWIKLLWPDHTRADAEQARARGLQVLVRAPGAGLVHWEEVLRIIEEFRGVCDMIEVGNEPFPNSQYPTWDDLLWNHAWYLETVWQHCAAPAHAAQIRLCTPGWPGDKEPPGPGTFLAGVNPPPPTDLVLNQPLATRLRQVYSAYDAIAVHCYDPFALDLPSVFDRIARWHALFDKPVFITEYGIAARVLPGTDAATSDRVKAQRYAAFLRSLAGLPTVEAAFLFLLGGSNDFAACTAGGYDPQGENSYWLNEAAYSTLGQALASATDAGERELLNEAAPAPRHIAWNDRAHGPDFPVLGPPTISPAVFAGWLAARHSPALQEADALTYYRAVLDRGINPALALAFFHHESQCGADPEGVAVRYHTKNWGNLRPRNDGSIGRAAGKTPLTQWGVFRAYHTYMDGLLDWCDLWFLPIYRDKSVRAALQIYAPPQDGNDPHSYANIVLQLLARWDRESGAFDLPAPPPPALPDYPLLGPASIPLATFTQALEQASSPVLQEADSVDYYLLCAALGVDPAVALAFFGQETAYGTQEGATANKNWANLWDPAQGRHAIFATWLDGLRELCARWQQPPFTTGGPPTVARLVPLHRGTQQPDNAAYIRHIGARIRALQSPAPSGAATTPDSAGAAPGPDQLSRQDGAERDLRPKAQAGRATTGAARTRTRLATPVAGRGGIAIAPVPAPARELAGPQVMHALPYRAGAGGDAAAPASGRSALAEWVGTKGFNFTAGRRNRRPIAVSNHIMMGTLAATIDTFQTRRLPGRGASANYGIGRTGRIVQFVDDNDTAWANGPIYNPNLDAVPWIAQVRDQGWDPNALTISIEWEGMHGDGEWIAWQGEPRATLRYDSVTRWWVPSEQQYQAGLALIRDLCTRHQIALGSDVVELRQYICRHSDFDSGKKWFCPGGGFPLARLLEDLRANGPDDYPLVGPATISPARFVATLQAAGSPALAAAAGADYYQACLVNGVDPAVALAFFGQETNYGTQPGAEANKNWANLWDPAQRRQAVFATWLDGLRELAGRWQRPPFTDQGAPTVAHIVPLHRGAQQRDNALYIQQVCERIRALQKPNP